MFHVLPDVGPVYTVSVIPTGQGAGGYTMPLPEKDEMYLTKVRCYRILLYVLAGVSQRVLF